LYRTTTRDISARAKIEVCGHLGAISLAAVVNQIAITLCRRAQAATDPDLHE
jgi:hypothetical protein